MSSEFEKRRAANMARNQELLAGLSALPAANMASASAAAPSAPTRTGRRKTAVKSAPAVAERKSTRVVARTPVYKLEDLFPVLDDEDDVKTRAAAAKGKKRKQADDDEDDDKTPAAAAAATKSKKMKQEGDDEKKDDGGDDDGSGNSVASAGEEEKERARPSVKERHEWGLTRVTITEGDLSSIRADYGVMRLSVFAGAGTGAKKSVRITNGEFAQLNALREARGEKKIVRKAEADSEWVAASITASARMEERLREKAEKAKKSLGMA